MDLLDLALKKITISFTRHPECSAGTYKDQDMSECTKCQVNMISEAGATTCSDCTDGTVSNTENTHCGKLNLLANFRKCCKNLQLFFYHQILNFQYEKYVKTVFR